MSRLGVLYLATIGLGCFYGALTAAKEQSYNSFKLKAQCPPDDECKPYNLSILERYLDMGCIRNEKVMIKKHVIIAYDYQKRIAVWVLERLTKENFVKQDSPLLPSDLSIDELLPPRFQTSGRDFKLKKYTEGHLARSYNHVNSTKAYEECNKFSNIVPQVPAFQLGVWCKLEFEVKDLAKKHAKVYVCTGPIFAPKRDEDNKCAEFVNFEVIGPKKVAVPTHFFKVIVCENENNEIEKVDCYMVPNADLQGRNITTSYKTSQQIIENLAGFKIFPYVVSSEDSESGYKLNKPEHYIKEYNQINSALVVNDEENDK